MWLEQPRSGWTEFTVALSGPKSEEGEKKKNVGIAPVPGLALEPQT
jgi:hypothetical protein